MRRDNKVEIPIVNHTRGSVIARFNVHYGHSHKGEPYAGIGLHSADGEFAILVSMDADDLRAVLTAVGTALAVVEGKQESEAA